MDANSDVDFASQDFSQRRAKILPTEKFRAQFSKLSPDDLKKLDRLRGLLTDELPKKNVHGTDKEMERVLLHFPRSHTGRAG